MAGVDDFIALLESKGRRVLVADDTIDLDKLERSNEIFVLQLPERSTAAGGRAGGLGERKILKAYYFRCGKGVFMEVAEFDDPENLEDLDLPYHATALPVFLPNGTEKLVTGVVDKELVSSYKEILVQ